MGEFVQGSRDVAYSQYISHRSGVGRQSIKGYVRRTASLNGSLDDLDYRATDGVVIAIDGSREQDDVLLNLGVERATQLLEVLTECIEAAKQ